MNFKLEVVKGLVYWKRLLHADKVVGVVVDGRLNLNQDMHKMLMDTKATVTIGYLYVAPKNEFRRQF